MDPFQRLKIELHGYNAASEADRAHGKKILEVLDSILTRDEEELEGRNPPLELLAYAFNSIIFPNFLPELTSDLVQLMTMLEFYRLQITEKAADLLELNDFVEWQQSSQNAFLTKSEKDYCRSIVDNQKTLRGIFLYNVLTCCVMDLKRLWLANSNTDFWVRWNQYFNILQDEDRNIENISHSFHHGITPDEILTLQESTSQLVEFMDATIRTAAEQAGRGETIQEMFQSKAFCEQFISSTLPPDELQSFTFHRDFVLDAVERIEAIRKYNE